MSIATKKVKGRRTVRYESLDDLLADAEQMAGGDVQLLGNWSLGQILKHIAMALDSSIDGFDFSMPAPVRFVMAILMKKKYLTKSLPPGFKAPDKFTPAETSAEEGLAALREAVDRQRREPKRVPHPGFGKFTNKEWDNFHFRHAEMHMSFVIPKGQT